MPKRIQRQRKKGWRMPEGAVYVGRPSKWGNPFKIIPGSISRSTTADVTKLFREVAENPAYQGGEVSGSDGINRGTPRQRPGLLVLSGRTLPR